MRAIPLVLATGLFVAALAGCSQSPTTQPPPPTGPVRDPAFGSGLNYTALDVGGLPTPFLHCHAEQANNLSALGCNTNLTPTDQRQGNEVTIAVNPVDPKNIVGGAKDYFPTDAGQCVWDGVYVSHDGGATVQDRSFDGSPWRLTNSPTTFKPNYASQFWCTTDPVAYYSQDGKSFYYLLMAYQGDPVTASKTCENVCPPTPVSGGGAVNDWAFNRAIQIVAISHDGGDTFDTFTGVVEGSYPAAFHDKGWIAASTDGTIHIMWLASAVPGNIYFRSTDGGKTYSDPFIMANTVNEDAGQGSFVDVGPGPEVYAAWTGSAGIHLRTSLDEGKTWDLGQVVLNPHFGGNMPVLSNREQTGGFPAMATDKNADSPFANSVYFAFDDTCQDAIWSATCATSGNSNIYVVASHDGGKTFGKPVRINDDVPAGGKADKASYHFMPAISVSPGGVLDVQWFDTREHGSATTPDTAGNTAAHGRIDQDYSYSLDGGLTWAKNVRVRDAADAGWDPALCHHQDGKIFFGDYQDIDSSWRAAHPVWPDSRDGKQCKVYTAELERPWFAEGWDPAKRAAAETIILAHPL